jgi:hypothetical protein
MSEILPELLNEMTQAGQVFAELLCVRMREQE